MKATMHRKLKNILFAVIGLAAVANVVQWSHQRGTSVRGEDDGTAPAAGTVNGTPLTGHGLRFDGHYRAESAKVVYVVRFFPEGHAVLANGTLDVEHQLPGMLVPNATSNPRIGHYNVPVQARDDSLFFTTHPVRGEIDYRGKVLSPEQLRFVRHSHITGDIRSMDYLFIPDGAPSK